MPHLPEGRQNAAGPSDASAGAPMELELETHGGDLHQPHASIGRSGGSVILPKTPFRVRLRLVDGGVVEGDVFLGTDPDMGVEESLLHFLEELRDGFFPLREPGQGAAALLHTRALQWLATRLEGVQTAYAEKHRILVDLGHGQMLEGCVILDADIISPRVSDVLNQARPYLALHAGNELYLINRASILRVYDLGKC